MKFANIPCNVKTFGKHKNSNLLEVDVLVCHDGVNKNGSKFSLENIKKAEPTLANIPILAFIKRDDEGNAMDFDGHNMITKLVETDEGYSLKYHYLEKPIGVIPSDNNAEYVVINDRTYLKCKGFIWSKYANEGYDLIMESDAKGTSMEIEVEDGARDEDGIFDITDFCFTAVTVLGDDVEPGMHDTCMTKFASSRNYKSEIEEIYKEIFKLREEECVLENIEQPVVEEVIEEMVDEVVETVEEVTEEVVEPTIEEVAEEQPVIEEPVVEEVVEEDKKEFSLEIFNCLLNEIPETVEGVVEALVEKFNAINEELDKLKEFKAEFDKKELANKVEEVCEKFNLEADITDVKTKALNGEVDLIQFEKELGYLYALQVIENNKFSNKAEEKVEKIIVQDISNEPKKKPYGGLLG